MVWEDLIKVALIGTDLSEISEGTKDALEKLGVNTKETPAKVLLEGASIFSQMQKAGYEPQSFKGDLPEPCELSATKICSKKSSDHLAQILNGIYEDVLEEFIQYLIHYKKSLPPEMLPDLFEKCRSNKELWKQIRFAIDERGYWLIQQNPDWQFLAGTAEVENWEIGTKDERLTILQFLRSKNPVLGLEKIESTWEEDDLKLRVAFVKMIDTNLSLADEDFLEKCLNDKRKDIRREAANLLSKLEGSKLIERMFERVKEMITLKSRTTKKEKIDITLPDILQEEMIRDGLDPRKKWGKGGMKASYFAQMFITIPPSKWELFFGKKAKEILSIFVRSEWSEMLVQVSIDATIHWKDENWMVAIMDFYFKNHDKDRWENLKLEKLYEILPAKIFNQFAITTLSKAKGAIDDDEPVCILLEKNRINSWDKDLTIYLMRNIKRVISQNISYSWQYVHYRNILESAGYCSDPNLYESLNKAWENDDDYWTGWGKEIDNFLQILKFRKDMILELQPILEEK